MTAFATKVCTTCELPKLLCTYGKGTDKDGRSRTCHECSKKYARAWRVKAGMAKARPEEVRL